MKNKELFNKDLPTEEIQHYNLMWDVELKERVKVPCKKKAICLEVLKERRKQCILYNNILEDEKGNL